MKKLALGILTLVSFIGGHNVFAREFRTPLRAWPFHYPFHRYENEDRLWDVDVWGTGYYREADKSFCDCSGTDKGPLTRIFFNKADFRAAEAFANSDINGLTNNPWATISTMHTRAHYNEKGAILGVQMERCFKKKCRAGARVRLPYRAIKMERPTNDCEPFCGETLEDVCQRRLETIEGTDPNGGQTTNKTLEVYAYRLDFLSALNRVVLGVQDDPVVTPLVEYRNNGHLRISDVDVDTEPVANIESNVPFTRAAPPIEVIKSDDGTVPDAVRWGNFPTTGNTVVAANGGGLIDQQRGRFSEGTDYSGAGNLEGNVPAQSQLFVVPSVHLISTDNAPNVDPEIALTDGANVIQDAIATALNNITGKNACDFFCDCDVSFGDQRNAGIGDLDLQTYFAYDWNDRVWNELWLGVVFPTGDSIDCCKDVNECCDVCPTGDCCGTGVVTKSTIIKDKKITRPFYVSRGNGGHFEVNLGLAGGYDALDWFKLTYDAKYSWVIKATEQIPAAFKGACIKNLGPCVAADVSWGYFLGHLDLTFVEPQRQCTGFTVGYELYHKTRDDICFQCCEVKDCLGKLEQVDNCVAEHLTKQTAHKLRLQLFHYGECLHLFGGWSTVFAGRNALNEAEWHVGMQISF